MEPPPTVWHCDSDGKGCPVIVAMWQIAEANVRIMQKQRGAATWMHLMGFDNVKISISTKKSEDLHKVFPEINRYIKSGWGFNFCKETATFIMQFAASPVAGENTKFSIRSNWDEFRSKLKVKCLCHSLFSMKFPWSLLTLTNQSRSWDVHIAFYIFDDSWISASQIHWRCCCHCHAVLPVLGSSVILSSVKMCLVYKEALLILYLHTAWGETEWGVWDYKSREVSEKVQKYLSFERRRYSQLINRFVHF